MISGQKRYPLFGKAVRDVDWNGNNSYGGISVKSFYIVNRLKKDTPSKKDDAWRVTAATSCRDSAMSYSMHDHPGTGVTADRFIYGVNNEQEGIKIAHFIRVVEKKMGIRQKTQVRPVYMKKRAICIDISPFWTESRMQFSFFTAMVRAGNEASQNSVAVFDVFRKSHYFADNMPAVRAFLKGNIKFSRESEVTGGRAWKHFMDNKNAKDVSDLLKKASSKNMMKKRKVKKAA